MMANHKQTCLSATERVYHTRTVDTLVCYHREMAKILMNSEYCFPKENKVKKNDSDNLETKIKNHTIEKKSSR